MSYRRFQMYFFVVVLGTSALLTLAVFWPYLTLLAFGGVFAVLARPLYSKLLGWLRSEVAAAFLSVIVGAIAVVLPLAFFVMALSTELVGAVASVRAALDADSFGSVLSRVLPATLHDQIPLILEESIQVIRGVAEYFSTGLIALFSNIFTTAFGFIVVLICTYYLLKDGSKVKKELLALSPLGDVYDQLVFDRVTVAVRAVMGGTIVVALLKGVVAALAYWIFGIGAPLFWGAMTGLASLIPVVGIAIIAAPAVLYLFVAGKVGAAIGLGLVAVAIIGTVDNFLQPKLVQSKTQIHPLLILLSILGGLSFYGFGGFVLGPLTLAVTMALIDIYKKEFRTYVETVESGE